MKIGQLANRRL